MTDRTRFASGEKPHILTPMIDVAPGAPVSRALFLQVWPGPSAWSTLV